ncbi:MAG: flippase-like domain-containing protein, partial [candidate division WOR-3 bacterium]
MKKENLKKVWNILRIVFGIGLILVLLWRLDINKILSNIGSLDISYLLYALIPYFLFIIFSAWRWQVLLNFKKFTIPFG